MGLEVQPAGSITVKDMWKEGHDAEWVLLAGLGHHFSVQLLQDMFEGT